MRSLVIHNDNVALNYFDHSIKFSASDSNIDKYITYDLIPKIKDLDFEILYIKDNLTSNYLDVYGLRLAYHIRLSLELKEKRFVPIVILSDIDSYFLNKITQMARVLSTGSIHIIKNNIEAIEQIETKPLKPLTPDEYERKFLNLIKVEAPQESHHDIANEWSIYRWAEFLQIKDSKTIDDNKVYIASMLYFKYLVVKYPLPVKRGLKIIPKAPTSNGKILYIDDEWNSGWKDIFSRYFSKVGNITFETIEKLNKDTKYDQLKEFVSQYITSNNPDLIILDLRLVSEDHKKDIDEKDISGIKLLKYIKEKINPGIQVLMLTASGKSLILNEAHKYGILGYIKKEHPEDTSINTKDNFTKLKELIDKGLEKKYLKEIWQLQSNILGLDIFDNEKYNQIKIEIESIFEILNSDMQNKFTYAMLSIFKCIELINDYFIIEKYDDVAKKNIAYWREVNRKIDNNGNNSTENKITSILYNKLNYHLLGKDIKTIVCCRNYAIHGKKKPACRDILITKINDVNIVEWLSMLHTILSKV